MQSILSVEVMNSASRKRKSRQARTEDKLTQDREVNRARQQRVRQSRTEDKLTQDCEANTAAQRGKRGSNYHRLHIFL